MKKRCVVRLSAEERDRRGAAYRRRHAQVLLLVDEGEHGTGMIDREVAERVGCTGRTVEQIRERGIREGLQAALERRARSRERSRVLDGQGEARWVGLACSEPPSGRCRWTLRMPGDRLVEVVESGSTETVRQVLKNTLEPWHKGTGCIRAEANAALVCQMEAVLEVYRRGPDRSHPVVGMDETTVQCIKGVRAPRPAQPGQSERYDVECERNAVAHRPAFYAPFENRRRGQSCGRAQGIRRLIQESYPEAQRITLVMDNLNTHTGASSYKAFPPGSGPFTVGQVGICLHPQVRELAQHGRMRVQCVGSPVSGPAVTRHRDLHLGNRCMDERAQPIHQARRLAFHHRGCAYPVEASLSESIRLMEY